MKPQGKRATELLANPAFTPKRGRQNFANLPVVSFTPTLSRDFLTWTEGTLPTPEPESLSSSLESCNDRDRGPDTSIFGDEAGPFLAKPPAPDYRPRRTPPDAR